MQKNVFLEVKHFVETKYLIRIDHFPGLLSTDLPRRHMTIVDIILEAIFIKIYSRNFLFKYCNIYQVFNKIL